MESREKMPKNLKLASFQCALMLFNLGLTLFNISIHSPAAAFTAGATVITGMFAVLYVVQWYRQR
jgi:hypothetical protein